MRWRGKIAEIDGITSVTPYIEEYVLITRERPQDRAQPFATIPHPKTRDPAFLEDGGKAPSQPVSAKARMAQCHHAWASCLAAGPEGLG